MRELRGVPIVGPGRKSAIAGSDPLTALLAKERRGRLVLVPREPVLKPVNEVRVVRRRKLGRRVSAPDGKFF